MSTRFHLLLLLLWPAGTSGEVWRTENFESGANGWAGALAGPLFAAEWVFTDNVAQVTFADIGAMPFPDNVVLSNSPYASGGVFTGSLAHANAELLGFRVRYHYSEVVAASTPPTFSLDLRWAGGDAVYRRTFEFPKAATGIWHTVGAALTSYEEGGWTTDAGSPEDFHDALHDVHYISLNLGRFGTQTLEFQFDEIFVDRLPQIQDLAISTDGLIDLWVGFLRTNVQYQMQTATSLSGPWTSQTAITATNRFSGIALTNSVTPRFFRIIQ